MDPLSKRRVWTMIQRLKTNRVMLLTTHSMEEADALGDKIAIMDSGRLRASGSSLFLKTTFGKGHTVSLLSEPENAPRVADIVKQIMPAAEVMGSNAGNTSVSLPRAAMKGLPRLFSTLMAERGLVKEWGISNTTLEEVFLRL
jgi:ABC-type multidrug transport system ATPase subunit